LKNNLRLRNYKAPTGPELRRILRALKLTGAAAAALVQRTSRGVRRWTGGDRTMGYSDLYCLVHRRTGVKITPENWREELAELEKLEFCREEK